ncbi:MAG: glycosyltransferase family 2 protein [Coriobacteriia bacterium]
MSEAPLVSVVVPMYNVEHYLPKCVDSILAQTKPCIEVILVDDCSPDGCARIADGYAAQDGRVRVVRRQENGTLGPARNSGLDVARGEYVMFVDSDDWVDEAMIEELYAMAKGHGADVCYSGFRSVRNGEVALKCPHPMGGMAVTMPENVARFRLEFYGAPPNKQAESPYPISACATLYLRSFLKENGLRFEAMRSEDIAFNVQALRRARTVACASGVYYNYRNDGQPSITRSFSDSTAESFYDLFERLAELADGEVEPWRDEARVRTARRIVDYARVLVGLVAASSEAPARKRALVGEVCANEHVARAARAVLASRLPAKQGVFLFGLRNKLARLLLLLTGLHAIEKRSKWA